MPNFDGGSNSETISVPTGYIKYLRKVEQKGYFYSASKLLKTLIAPKLADFGIENYKLNSIFNFGASPDKIDETEYYFEHTTHVLSISICNEVLNTFVHYFALSKHLL